MYSYMCKIIFKLLIKIIKTNLFKIQFNSRNLYNRKCYQLNTPRDKWNILMACLICGIKYTDLKIYLIKFNDENYQTSS